MTATATLQLTAKQIAETVNGHLIGDGSLPIKGAATLADAGVYDISFFHNPKYMDQLATTQAKVLLLPEKINVAIPALPGKTLIKVANPQFAFAQVLVLLDHGRVHHPQGIHPKAVVDPSATLGKNVSIGANAVVERDAHIGDNTIVYPGVFVGERVHLGERCLVYPNVVFREDTQVGNRAIIHAGAVLGADGYGFSTQQGKHLKIPQIGRVVIEEDVEVGANVTIDRATTGETRIGAGTKIDNLVHIAHNVHIGKNCLIVAQVGISGSTKIGNNVTLAGQVGVVGHLTIEDGAIIAAQSGIMNDVKAGEILFGSPARPHRETLKIQAVLGKLPELYDTVKALKKKFLSES